MARIFFGWSIQTWVNLGKQIWVNKFYVNLGKQTYLAKHISFFMDNFLINRKKNYITGKLVDKSLLAEHYKDQHNNLSNRGTVNWMN